jgi:hypothetical protein
VLEANGAKNVVNLVKRRFLVKVIGSGSYENGSSFKVVPMEKKTQTSIMHIKRF